MEQKSSTPRLPLPQPLVGAEVGTFTEFTVTQRMPNLARRVIEENQFPPNIEEEVRIQNPGAEPPAAPPPVRINQWGIQTRHLEALPNFQFGRGLKPTYSSASLKNSC
ncbi:hypothetical protein [Brasilonema sp. UFV-L1]|uniref:hypothetical protein n=1 Tax=Brasilonema sp. UFV-L1 TaxID=2234130 RepID=UPI00145D8078